MSKPTIKDVAKDLIDAIRLLRHVEDQLDRFSDTPDELVYTLIIEPLQSMVLEYLKGR